MSPRLRPTSRPRRTRSRETTTGTSDRGGPQRTCVGCRARRAQADLVRCAVSADGVATVSRSAPGRGAWLCRGNVACFRQAIARRGFDRAWRRSVSREALDGLTTTFELLVDDVRELSAAGPAADRSPEKG